jgi:hypothetical protein
MKKSFLFLFVLLAIEGFSQIRPFRFAFISDTHIGSSNGNAEMDLRRTVRDINGMSDIAFAVLTGDITELGTNDELQLARQILDSLDVPYHIIPEIMIPDGAKAEGSASLVFLETINLFLITMVSGFLVAPPVLM